MALKTTLSVAAVALLAVIALIPVGKFLASESSSDPDVNTRSLRISTKKVVLDQLLAGVVEQDEPTRDECMESPNRTVIQKEDLELSCAAFRSSKRPTTEEAFAHLGKQAVKDARELSKRIKEQQKSGGVRIAIGTGPGVPEFGNFIPTDYPIVDICNATRLSALLDEASVEAMFASHVWEHFTYPQAIQALQNVRCLMTDNAVARLGVPDAQHPDKVFHEKKVREGFPDRNFRAAYRDSFYAGHRALWNEEKFAVAASLAGLNVRPLEWWSAGSREERKFCYNEYNSEVNGRINRSLKFDSRNTKEHPYAYTSLIVDLSPQVLEE